MCYNCVIENYLLFIIFVGQLSSLSLPLYINYQAIY